jgi:nucleoid DNA-binding protein
MTKQELIDAIVHGAGVRVSALSKEELLRVARSTGSEVDTAMTKSELIATIATP